MRKKLRELRKMKNLTQDEMAKILNISRAYYGMIETGKRNPNLLLAKKIAEFHNINLEEIFFADNATK